MATFRELQEKLQQIEESYYSRLATAIDELVNANPRLTSVQLVGKARIELGDEAAKYLSDKLETEGDFLDYDSRAPAAKNPVRKHMKGFRKLGEGDVVPFPTTVPYEKATKIMTTDEYYQQRNNFPPHDVDFNQEPNTAYVHFKGDYSDAADWDSVEEGFGKSLKRGIKGWDKRDMGFGPSDPKGLRDRVRNMSDEQLDTLYDDTGKASPGSPQAFQQKVIRQEMKRRGITKDVEDNFMYDNPFESVEEDANVHTEDPISQQIASLLAQGKQVVSNIAGAMGRVTRTDGRYVYVRHPGRQEGFTSFDGDPKIKLVGGIDHYKIIKDYSDDQGILGQVARREGVEEARGNTVEVPAGLRGEDPFNKLGLTSKDAEDFIRELGIDDQIDTEVVDPETGEVLFDTGTTKRQEGKKGNYQKLNYKDFTAGRKLREPESPIFHAGWDNEDYEAKMDKASETLNELRDSDFYNVVWKEMSDLVDDPDDMADKDYDVSMDIPIAIKRKDGQRFNEDDHDNFREIVKAVKNMSTMGNTGIVYAGTTNDGTVARFTPSFF